MPIVSYQLTSTELPPCVKVALNVIGNACSVHVVVVLMLIASIHPLLTFKPSNNGDSGESPVGVAVHENVKGEPKLSEGMLARETKWTPDEPYAVVSSKPMGKACASDHDME